MTILPLDGLHPSIFDQRMAPAHVVQDPIRHDLLRRFWFG
jgi:hypothetical protein